MMSRATKAIGSACSLIDAKGNDDPSWCGPFGVYLTPRLPPLFQSRDQDKSSFYLERETPGPVFLRQPTTDHRCDKGLQGGHLKRQGQATRSTQGFLPHQDDQEIRLRTSTSRRVVGPALLIDSTFTAFESSSTALLELAYSQPKPGRRWKWQDLLGTVCFWRTCSQGKDVCGGVVSFW